MSTQIAKSPATVQTSRRTSLSLQSSSGNKAKNTSNDPKKDKNDVGESQKPEPADKKCESSESIEKKIENTPEKITKTKPESSGKQSPKSASKSNENGKENGINNKDKDTKSNGHENMTKKQNDKEERKDDRDGLRQKSLKDTDENSDKKEQAKEMKKGENKAKNEKTEETKNENKDKVETVEMKNEKKIQEVKLTPAAKNTDEEQEKSRVGTETPKKSDKQNKTSKTNSPTVRETRRTVTGSRNEAQETKIDEDVVLIEDDEEMESLIVESEIAEEHPLKKTETGRILKLKQKAPITPQETQKPKSLAAKIDFQPTISSSTYTDKHVSKSMFTDPAKTNTHPASTSSSNDRAYLTSYRAISGRRSLRSTSRDITYQSNYRESYRKINTELDNTSSSLNVTVGSEIPNDSSFSFLSRGRKRDRTPPAGPIYAKIKSHEDQSADEQDDTVSDTMPKSPKRARLDFSTIFGIVASPVTMLRSRLSRAKLQCSTPNGKLTEKDNESEEGVENVSEIEAEEAIENDNIIDEDDDVIIKESEDSHMKNKTSTETAEVLPTGDIADFRKEKNSDVDNISDTDSVTGQPLMNQAKKKNCIIM